MFTGFERRRIPTGSAEIAVLIEGHGPPLVLLHGYPQNHVAWHAVAERLRGRFSLVIPDLRGYGASIGPAPDADHIGYSKRAMASDVVELMEALGHPRFAVAGHDRGARVAYRLALDRPDVVDKLAVLDIIPTLEVWERMDSDAAMRAYHWLLLCQPAPFPERLIGCDPDLFLRYLLTRWAGHESVLHPDAVARYSADFRKPTVITAACEDYRAGATVDVEQDRADRQRGRKIERPVLLLWSRRFLHVKGSTPLQVWQAWATDVREVAFDCGHFIAEEAPAACAAALETFFAR